MMTKITKLCLCPAFANATHINGRVVGACSVASGYGVGFATRWLRGQLPAAALSSNNLRQVVHTHVHLYVAVV